MTTDTDHTDDAGDDRYPIEHADPPGHRRASATPVGAPAPELATGRHTTGGEPP